MSISAPTSERGKIFPAEDDPEGTLAAHTAPGSTQDHLNGRQVDPVAEAIYREGRHIREAYQTAMGTLSRGGIGGSVAPA